MCCMCNHGKRATKDGGRKEKALRQEDGNGRHLEDLVSWILGMKLHCECSVWKNKRNI